MKHMTKHKKPIEKPKMLIVKLVALIVRQQVIKNYRKEC